MAGVSRLLVVWHVAGGASRIGSGQSVIAAPMALLALQGGVRAGEGESCGGVVERRGSPRDGVVALLAGGGESCLHVARVVRVVVVGLMASHAGRIGAGQIVVAIDVALLALQRRMRAGEWKAGSGMVKGGVHPRGRVVALLASRGEAGLHVVGIGSPLEILHVAGRASRGRAGEDSVHMALSARHIHVRAGEWKRGELVVIERHPCPVDCGVADGAILREAGLHVAGILGARVVLHVATYAICGANLEVPVQVAR